MYFGDSPAFDIPAYAYESNLEILFYAIERIPYNHAIWHVFVIAGSCCHYLAVLWYVVPINLLSSS